MVFYLKIKNIFTFSHSTKKKKQKQKTANYAEIGRSSKLETGFQQVLLVQMF